jgi:pimeloyl-ACP methyl ester carboxylesterase
VTEAKPYAGIYFQSADDLRLHARDYHQASSSLAPVLCLPGLTRNSRDFETVAPVMAQKRRVIAVDFRGRGLSQHAADPMSYRPDVELGDVMALLDHLKIGRVALLGTSRGGIVAMLMAALFKDRLAGVFLNDIGPRLEAPGLLRIRSYLGVGRNFRTWDDAVEGLQRSNPGFEKLTAAEWHAFARRVFRLIDGSLRPDYDLALASTFPTVEDIEAGKVAELWEVFAQTQDLPTAVLRGEHSDLLSAETVHQMKEVNRTLRASLAPDRGHAPFLDEPQSRHAIDRWLESVDDYFLAADAP